jgi:MFS family permease
MLHDHDGGTLVTVYVIANLAIVAGYFVVPFTLLGRRMPMTLRVRVAGILFFATCAVTHLAMALFWPLWTVLIISHVLQACAVWYFVIGFSRLIGEAEVRRRRRAAAASDQPGPVNE